MLKGHPKGLYVFLFANMGERFGYYTMIAIFTLFLQARFGMSAGEAGNVYGAFLFGVYFVPLIGGIIADKVLGFGKTITLGIILMIVGYIMLAMPGDTLMPVYLALAVISIGTGFFKGNLQALVGKLYDESKIEGFRDAAFNIFYMGINIGAFFAPSAAEAMNNYIMKKGGFIYNGRLPEMANDYLANPGGYEKTQEFMTLAKENIIDGAAYQFTDLSAFANDYIGVLSESYNWGFGIAAVSILMSLLIFIGFRKYYKHVDLSNTERKAKDAADAKDVASGKVKALKPEQVRKRTIALILVFVVNIFFWMAFHQNGFTLTIFARDFTVTQVQPITYALFDLNALLPIIAAIIGLVFLIGKSYSKLLKGIGAAMVVAGSAIAYFIITGYSANMPINPVKFQHFNPIFIVFVTPVILGIFTALRKRGKEPTAPKKIGIGLFIAGASFVLMIVASMGFIKGETVTEMMRVTPYWLIGTYFSLTIAELFYSPIGISFVSKVSPPKFQGLAQGGWLGSTAIGNLLSGLIGGFWESWSMWQFFLLLTGILILSSIFIFSILKILDNATSDE
jgi:POT family proton-dependent oligopeptide transporter